LVPPLLLLEIEMARSLTVKHEEKVSTSLLLNAFLLLAVLWLALSAVGGNASTDQGPQPATAEEGSDNR
jgi:hypothetical protein